MVCTKGNTNKIYSHISFHLPDLEERSGLQNLPSQLQETQKKKWSTWKQSYPCWKSLKLFGDILGLFNALSTNMRRSKELILVNGLLIRQCLCWKRILQHLLHLADFTMNFDSNQINEIILVRFSHFLHFENLNLTYNIQHTQSASYYEYWYLITLTLIVDRIDDKSKNVS